ncbi:MAG: hypothetical protein ACJAYY_002599 [Paraglaciecola sp.]|jgi:hypothetical protein
MRPKNGIYSLKNRKNSRIDVLAEKKGKSKK